MMLTNALIHNKYLSGLLFVLGCLSFTRCSEKHDDPVLIQVGDYTVTRGKFREGLDKLNAEGLTLTEAEKMQMVFDDLINAGLLLRLSRQHGCVNNVKYQRDLAYYERMLQVKYGKMAKCGWQALPAGINDDAQGTPVKYSTVIDYIYIPSSQRDIYKEMQDRMNTGANTSDLQKSPDIDDWNRLHLRFYTDTPTSSALLPEKILQKIKKMKIGEVSSFEDGPGKYIIKVTKHLEGRCAPQSAGEHWLQLQMAKCVEEGDTLMDPYDLDRMTQINYDLLERFNFALLPTMDSIIPGDSNPVVVEFLGKKIHETQLKSEIGRLPLSIQALFRNKLTRVRAMMNYVLHTNAGLPGRVERERMADVSRIRRFIGDGLKADRATDTVSWLMNVFRQKSANGHLTSAYAILTNAIGGRTSVPEDKELPIPEKMRDYSWILDDHQPGIEYLRLNFPVIQKMNFGRGAGIGGNPILASEGHWTLRVGDFRKQLKRLTPDSRLELCRNDNGIKAIYYLAHNQGRLANNASIKINYALADQIDMVGDDFDSLNDFNTDEVIASLQHTVLTEEKIRNIITTLPEEERFHFLHECDSRYFALEDILVGQFWRDQLDPRQLEGNPQYKKDVEAYTNWLLANTYFNTVINIEPLELSDETLDPYIKKACKLLSQERLREALLNAAQRTCIKVDVNLFRVLGGNITGSAYSGLINKNCH